MSRLTCFSLFIAVVTYLIFTSTAFAIPKPSVCPSPDTLRSATWVLTKDDDEPNQYTAGAVGNFGTANEWMGIINCITATTEEEARQIIANSILPNIFETSDIENMSKYDGDSESWDCMYKTTHQFPSNCHDNVGVLTPVPYE